MTDTEFYIDSRIREYAKEYVRDLVVCFGNTIAEKLNNDIERYKKYRVVYAKLLESAKDKKRLTKDVVTALKKLRKFFTANFALPRKLQMKVYDKTTKKRVRVPIKVLKWHVSKVSSGIFRLMEHGRDAYSGYQFKNYYTVKFAEIDRLMNFINKSRNNQHENTKQENKNSECSCHRD